jgi:HSP20 family protein
MNRTILTWNPIEEIRNLEAMFNSIWPQSTPAPAVVPVDVTEENGAMIVRASMPGIPPEKIDVSIEGNVLTIQGEYSHETVNENTKVYIRELSSGKISRSIRLPKNLNLEQVEARFENGIVEIHLPKLEPEKPEALRIPVKAVETTASAEGQAQKTLTS